MSNTSTRLSVSCVTLTFLLTMMVSATPQGYQPFRPYDPTSASNNAAISSSTTTSADIPVPGAAAAIFGNDDGDGLDNGVDDNNGTPFGINTNRGGSGSNGEEPTPPEPFSCSGSLQCCNGVGQIIDVRYFIPQTVPIFSRTDISFG